ncbi:MAG: hypothetical protein RI969_331 [Verrucomicrobiota bacterium]
MPPFRRFLFAALTLGVLPAFAETVQLRRTGNATVIAFEYITQDETTIMVKRLDADTVLTYRWEDLDQDWIKRNNPKLWAERELMLEADKPSKKMAAKEEEDPFAQPTLATDAKSLVRNLLVSLQDGMKGMSLSANRPEVVCNEFQLDENLFWLAFDDLKRASLLSGKPDNAPRTEAPAEDAQAGSNKTKVKGKTVTRPKGRSPESQLAEAAARKDFETEARPYNALGYLRTLAEGGTKGKPIWMMLRRTAADREAMKTMLLQYAAQAEALAEKPEAKASKTDLLVLKKALENCAESIGRVNREFIAVEARLQSDCRTVLTLVLR